MFVLTLNKKKSGKFAVAIIAVAFLVGIGFGVKNFIFRNQETSTDSKVNLKMKTTQEMADYILSKGYTVDLQSAQVKEVRIPKKFDAEFENFDRKINKTDNLSLKKYKNDKVNKWTFAITDYEVKDKTATAVLLVRKDKLIGAYLLQHPDGTAQPLQKSNGRGDILE